ncbi:MAG: hypothetical protein WCE73_15655 [Candidatus Angelobacter sp.]|jgi:hypothetical protein
MLAARDPFQVFHAQLTAAHPIEHTIIVVARHKFLLLVLRSSSNMGKQGLHDRLSGGASTMIFMAYTAIRTEAPAATRASAVCTSLGLKNGLAAIGPASHLDC